MSKKDYELVASVFRLQLEHALFPVQRQTIRDMAHMMAAELAADNPKFTPARFLAACGL